MNPSKASCSALPYRFDELEPVLSRKVVEQHFQHHRRLYELAVAATRGTPFGSLSLEALARVTTLQPQHRGLCALATKVWNHDLYWRSLRPGAGGEARGPIGDLIRSSFGGFETFVRRMREASSGLVGRGWLWVAWRAGAIEVLTTQQAHSPIKEGHVPLLAIDLWEHAYRHDYDHSRAAYVSACLRHLIDWAHANERLLEVNAAETHAPLARWRLSLASGETEHSRQGQCADPTGSSVSVSRSLLKGAAPTAGLKQCDAFECDD